MYVAPHAKPDDGIFDVIVMGDESPWYTVLKSHLIYSGKHLDEPKCWELKGKKITAIPVEGEAPVLLDMDGEVPGKLPASFEILPGVLKIRH